MKETAYLRGLRRHAMLFLVGTDFLLKVCVLLLKPLLGFDQLYRGCMIELEWFIEPDVGKQLWRSTV